MILIQRPYFVMSTDILELSIGWIRTSSSQNQLYGGHHQLRAHHSDDELRFTEAGPGIDVSAPIR